MSRNERPEPVILGVFADASVKMGIDVTVIRACWVIGLCVLGPVAPLVYVFVWFLGKGDVDDRT